MQTPPKPSLSLCLIATLLIVSCLLLVAWLLSAAMLSANLANFVAVAVVSVGFATVVWILYAGAFRGDFGWANSAAVISFLSAVLLFMGCLSRLKSPNPWDEISAMAGYFLFALLLLQAALAFAAGWLYRRHAVWLKASGYRPVQRQFSLKELLLFTTTVAVIFGLASLVAQF